MSKRAPDFGSPPNLPLSPSLSTPVVCPPVAPSQAAPSQAAPSQAAPIASPPVASPSPVSPPVVLTSAFDALGRSGASVPPEQSSSFKTTVGPCPVVPPPAVSPPPRNATARPPVVPPQVLGPQQTATKKTDGPTFQPQAGFLDSSSVASQIETEEATEPKPGVWFSFQDSPSWLISLLVHLAIILLLAIVPLSDRIGQVITIISGESLETGTDELTAYESSHVEETMEMEIPEASVLESIEFEDIEVPSILPSFDMSSPDIAIRSGLSGRSGFMKETLLKAYGGTKGTEDAVAAGLAWLAKQQRSNGSWSLVGPYKGGATSENESAATAMAMLAFLGAGHTHKSDTEYSKNVKNGMSFLLSIQNEDGFFASKAIGNHRAYAQAQCTIAICELYGLTSDPILEPVALRAIRYANRAQGKDGGWRYSPKDPGDMSVTGWYVMALMSARMAGLPVDSGVLEDVHRFLDKVQKRGDGLERDSTGERYAYMDYTKASPAMTAEGMLCRLYLGWKADDQRIREGAELLCNNPVSSNPNRVSFYYWYYATTTLHHIGGEAWKIWNDEMKVQLPSLQEQSGPNKGSWSAADDSHQGAGGRLYATCLSIFCLETYYRHLPLNRLGHN